MEVPLLVKGIETPGTTVSLLNGEEVRNHHVGLGGEQINLGSPSNRQKTSWISDRRMHHLPMLSVKMTRQNPDLQCLEGFISAIEDASNG